jgi:hypothetical protein
VWLLCRRHNPPARIEQRSEYDGSDGITFFCTAVPVFLLCMVFNLVWAFIAVLDVSQSRDYRNLIAVGAVAIAWAGAYFTMRLAA